MQSPPDLPSPRPRRPPPFLETGRSGPIIDYRRGVRKSTLWRKERVSFSSSDSRWWEADRRQEFAWWPNDWWETAGRVTLLAITRSSATCNSRQWANGGGGKQSAKSFPVEGAPGFWVTIHFYTRGKMQRTIVKALAAGRSIDIGSTSSNKPVFPPVTLTDDDASSWHRVIYHSSNRRSFVILSSFFSFFDNNGGTTSQSDESLAPRKDDYHREDNDLSLRRKCHATLEEYYDHRVTIGDTCIRLAIPVSCELFSFEKILDRDSFIDDFPTRERRGFRRRASSSKVDCYRRTAIEFLYDENISNHTIRSLLMWFYSRKKTWSLRIFETSDKIWLKPVRHGWKVFNSAARCL